MQYSLSNVYVSFQGATEGGREKEAMFVGQRRLLQTSGLMVSELPHLAGNTSSCSPPLSEDILDIFKIR